MTLLESLLNNLALRLECKGDMGPWGSLFIITNDPSGHHHGFCGMMKEECHLLRNYKKGMRFH